MIRHWTTRLFALTVLVGAILNIGQPAVAQNDSEFKRAVDKTVLKEMKRQKIVGVSVGLISDNKIVYTKGYGFADLEERIPFDENTVINWASNSKPVMAVLAMQLVQYGQLDLDQTIDNYLADLPEHLHAVTTRQLLCHQSGMPHYSNGKIVPAEGFVKPTGEQDPVAAMNRFLQSPLIFKPGTKKDYSSYAYVLLSAVVQAAGNEPIATQLSTRIKDRLNLESFQMDVPFDNQENWSKPYRLVDGKPVELPDEANYWKHGAGGYKSNVKDFAKFANSFMKSRLLNRRTLGQMMKPQATSDGTKTDMGLGVYVAGSGKSLKISHNGSQPETKTRMVVYPNQKHGVVVMCNGKYAKPGTISTAIYGALKKLR